MTNSTICFLQNTLIAICEDLKTDIYKFFIEE